MITGFHRPPGIAVVTTGFLLLALGGCGASLTTRRLPTTQLDKVNGLVVNQNVPYELIAIFPTAPGATEVTYERAGVLLPSADEVYVINYCGQLFTSRSLDVELHPDTSVKRVKIDSKVTVEESLNNLTEAATQVGELRKALQKKEPSPAIDVENEKLQRELLNLMLKANVEAIRRGEQPPYKGSVSKVEMVTPIALIYKILFPSISTFEPPPSDHRLWSDHTAPSPRFSYCPARRLPCCASDTCLVTQDNATWCCECSQRDLKQA